MRIEQEDGVGFWTYYNNGMIIRSFSDWNENSITFYYSDGAERKFVIPRPIPLEVYNAQFGVTVSVEHNCFFFQTWTKGLYCFSLADGSELWRVKIRHAFDVMIAGDCVICWFCGHGIVRISVDSGEQLGRFSLTSELGNAVFIDDRCILAGEKFNAWYLLDSELNVIKKYASSELNPNGCDSFLIREAKLDGDSVVIEGIEGNAGQVGENMPQVPFTRSLGVRQMRE